MTFEEKINGLLLGVDGVQLNYMAQTIVDDGAVDTLAGEGDVDAFMSGLDDLVSDLAAGEALLDNQWARPPSSGVGVYSAGWSQGLVLGGAQRSKGSIRSISVSQMPFTEAVQAVSVVDDAPSLKDTQFNVYSGAEVAPGDQLYLTFFYRTTLLSGGDAKLRTRWHDAETGGYVIPSFELHPSAEWQHYVAVVNAPDFGQGSYKIRLNLAFGTVNQRLEIGGLQVKRAPAGSFAPGEFTVPQALQYPQQVPMLRSSVVPVLSNDTDAANDPLRVSALVSLPQHGTVTIDGANLIYESTEEFFGIEEFKYAVTDPYGNASVANARLLVRHDFHDGTWHVGNDPAIYSGSVRKQYFKMSDAHNSPYGSFGMGRGTDGDVFQLMDSHSNANTDFHYLIFGKKKLDGTIGFPTGWTWSIPHSAPEGNYRWAGVNLGGSGLNHNGISSDDIEEWIFNFDVENHNLGFRRSLFINLYWYANPDGKYALDGGQKTLDMGVFFLDQEIFNDIVELDGTMITIDGRQVYFRESIRRFYLIVDDFSRIQISDFDMAPYIRYLFDHGHATLPCHFSSGALDVELKHRDAHDTTRKTTGEFLVHDFDYMMHLDMAPQNAMADLDVPQNAASMTLPLSGVFQQVGADRLVPDGYGGVKGVTPVLTYTVSVDSNTAILDAGTTINGSDLILDFVPGASGVAQVAVRATDYLNRWYDEETFMVRVDDSDADGLPDSWEKRFGPDLSLLSAGGNQDGDAHTDYEEYLAGTNPTNAMDVLTITGLSAQGANGLDLTWSSVSGRVYQILRATNLLENVWIPVQTNEATQAESVIEVDSADKKAFWKIQLQR